MNALNTRLVNVSSGLSESIQASRASPETPADAWNSTLLTYLDRRREPSIRKAPATIDFSDSDKENTPPEEDTDWHILRDRPVAQQRNSEASESDGEHWNDSDQSEDDYHHEIEGTLE